MKLNVELVTPEALVFSADAYMVTAPGAEGDFGVLAGHAPMVSSLRPGIVEIYETASQLSKSIFVKDGFAEINQEGCTILAREAIDVTGNPEEAARLIREA